jgi:ribonuclease P protein component
MLPQKNRVDQKTAKKIFARGKSLGSKSFILKFFKEPRQSFPRLSFVAPKSIARTAVKRNRAKRIGYNILREHLKDFPKEVNGLFILKDLKSDSLEEEIKKVAKKI